MTTPQGPLGLIDWDRLRERCRGLRSLWTRPATAAPAITVRDSAVYDEMDQSPDFRPVSPSPESLIGYVQSLHPETVSRLSQPASPEVMKLMERNIIGMLGGLPSGDFEVTVTTSREQLGKLLASAMMSGYFLRNAEQRMAMERSLAAGLGLDSQDA